MNNEFFKKIFFAVAFSFVLLCTVCVVICASAEKNINSVEKNHPNVSMLSIYFEEPELKLNPVLTVPKIYNINREVPKLPCSEKNIECYGSVDIKYVPLIFSFEELNLKIDSSLNQTKYYNINYDLNCNPYLIKYMEQYKIERELMLANKKIGSSHLYISKNFFIDEENMNEERMLDERMGRSDRGGGPGPGPGRDSENMDKHSNNATYNVYKPYRPATYAPKNSIINDPLVDDSTDNAKRALFQLFFQYQFALVKSFIPEKYKTDPMKQFLPASVKSKIDKSHELMNKPANFMEGFISKKFFQNPARPNVNVNFMFMPSLMGIRLKY